MWPSKFQASLAVLTTLLLVGCATPTPKDYTAFKTADPKTILVLPPKNSSPEVSATYGVYTQVQRPIAESGYYILPVTLVDEHFKSNGLAISDETHLVDGSKLLEVFGADAALYVDIKDYGTKYMVFGSASVVTADGKLVDLRSGQTLWEGRATASSAEQSQNNNMGLAGLLVSALIKQVLATATDESYRIAAMTNHRLLSAKSPGGLLPGPRHPAYRK